MLPSASPNLSVYIAIGSTDLRKSINGLSIMVQECFELNPFSGCIFAFCNRKRNLIKLLYWHNNGFCLWMKRLEKDRFSWPDSDCELLEVSSRELSWLLEGLSIEQRKAHKKITYSTLI